MAIDSTTKATAAAAVSGDMAGIFSGRMMVIIRLIFGMVNLLPVGVLGRTWGGRAMRPTLEKGGIPRRRPR